MTGVIVCCTGAGSFTNTERWEKSDASKPDHNFFNRLPKLPSPKLPLQFESDFQVQQLAHHSNTKGYETKVAQPTFMTAIATTNNAETVAPAIEVAEWSSTKVVVLGGDLKSEFKLVGNNKNWLSGLRPDYGLFASGLASTAFSVLVVGDQDDYRSMNGNTHDLSRDHLGKNLAYAEKTLLACPFRWISSSH